MKCATNRWDPPSCDCIPGKYNDNGTCKSCDTICVTCSSSGCNECINPYVNPPDCTCSSRYYLDTTCKLCSFGCSTCNKSGCTGCDGNRTKVGTACVCPDNTYDDGTNH